MSNMFKNYEANFKAQETRLAEYQKERDEKQKEWEENNKPNPVYVGSGPVKVLAINPTEEELVELIGEVGKKFDTTYNATPDQYNDNKMSRPVAVWITDKDSKVSPTLINFRLVDTPRLSRDGKPQYLSLMEGVSPNGPWSILTTMWTNDLNVGDVDKRESQVGNAYTNTVLAPARVGEENYYMFLKTLLAWPNDGNFLEAMKEVGLDFDTVYGGDDTALRQLVAEELTKEVTLADGSVEERPVTFIGVFTAKLRDDDRVVQSFSMNNSTWFANASNADVLTKKNRDNLEKQREKRFARDGMDIIKDLYTLDPLVEYSEDVVKQNVSEDTNVDEWF